MTAPARLVELLLGPQTCLRLLDGSPEQAERLARWYLPLDLRHRFFGDTEAAEVLAAWHRVVDCDRTLAWWQRAGDAKPGLAADLLRRWPVGVMRIEVAGDGDWQPAEDHAGSQAAILFADLSADGQPLDMIAMDPADPAQWRARTGLAAAVPGDMAVSWAPPGATLRLYRHPLAWLAAGGPDGGLAILDWSVGPGPDLLDRINRADLRVVCDDVDHMREVAALARPRRPSMLLAVEAPPRVRGEAVA